LIIYNVTTAVVKEMAADWEQWLVQEHAPEIISTGCFIKFHLLKLLQLDDSEGTTYAVQYYAANKEDYERYINDHAITFRRKATDRWGETAVSFRTIMEVIQ
jgi:hypothetical protein